MVQLSLALGVLIVSFFKAVLLPPDSPVSSPENPNVEVIYQFPPPLASENEFLRSNGQLLVTCLPCNTLSQIDPSHDPMQKRRTLYTLPNGVIHVLSIDKLFEDVFAMAMRQVEFENFGQINTTKLTSLVRGPTAMWIVDLRNDQCPEYDSSLVQAYKVGGSNTAVLFDGLAVINPSRGLIATTDFAEGNIYLVDILRNTTTLLVVRLVLVPSSDKVSSLLLANGLKYKNSKLYFTASQEGTNLWTRPSQFQYRQGSRFGARDLRLWLFSR